MAVTKPYAGVFPVAPTPFAENGDLDLEGQRRVLNCMIDQGVDGICILANYSEQFLLTDSDPVANRVARTCASPPWNGSVAVAWTSTSSCMARPLAQACRSAEDAQFARAEGARTVRGFWKVDTARGRFAIVPVGNDFEARWEDESLGSYDSAEDALADLIGGNTLPPSRGFSTASVALPSDLAAWEFVRPD